MNEIVIKSKKEKILLKIVGLVFWVIVLLVGMFILGINEKGNLLSGKTRIVPLGIFVIFFISIPFLLDFVVDILSELRIIAMNETGCTVIWMKWRKKYKWDELSIIREDYWVSEKIEYEGVVFSVKDKKSKSIFESWDFLKCFYVLYLEQDEKSLSYPVEREEFIKQLNEWGVNVERGRELALKDKRRIALEIGKQRRKG